MLARCDLHRRRSGLRRATKDGETWEFDAWPAVVGHNWGTGHCQAYACGHCNAWDDPSLDLMLEGASGRIKLGPILMPARTLRFVRHRGVRYGLNTVFDLAKRRGKISTRRWKFKGGSSRALVSFTLSGRAPIVARSHKAALELGTHDPHHGVRMYV
jgi:hypothetical protein